MAYGHGDHNIDPALSQRTMYRGLKTYGMTSSPGAHMTLGGLQNLPLGYGISPYGPDPGFGFGPHPSHPHPPLQNESGTGVSQEGGGAEEGGEPDGEGEHDDGWNSNIIYSFSESGDITFSGERYDPESFRLALEAGLTSAGLTAVWQNRGALE